jgi:uncharacterized damage-inducible protein DinB
MKTNSDFTEIDLRSHLLNVCDSEYEANLLWLKFIRASTDKPNGGQFASKAQEWLQHICGCYQVWIDRLENHDGPRFSDLDSEFESVHKKLKDYVAHCDLNSLLESKDKERWSALSIIQHMQSHGSYHRGHLRALAEFHGLEDWPETDYLCFASVE